MNVNEYVLDSILHPLKQNAFMKCQREKELKPQIDDLQYVWIPAALWLASEQ